MNREGYEKEVQDFSFALAERLRGAGINLAFMDAGWKSSWISTSDHHEKAKYHTPPLTVALGASIDDLVRDVFTLLNSLYASYNGVLIKEDLKAHMAINSLTSYAYADGGLQWLMVFQATVIHVGEHVDISTRMKINETKAP